VEVGCVGGGGFGGLAVLVVMGLVVVVLRSCK